MPVESPGSDSRAVHFATHLAATDRDPSPELPPITRCHARFLLPLLLSLACVLPAHAQTVRAEGGDIVFQPRSGAPRRLTTGGLDSEPSLSPDGRTVVFVRRTPGRLVPAASGDAEATELWTVGVDGAGGRMRLRGRAADDPRATLAGLQAPKFSPDGRTVYFLSAAWATSGAVHALDLATGAARYVAPGNSLEVIARGEYRGHLIVSQHRYFLGGGSYDWLWVLTPGGREVGPIGDTPEALSQFRETYVDSESER